VEPFLGLALPTPFEDQGSLTLGVLMSQKRANRRLAAILAADVIGYSRMMGADEYGTLKAVKRLRTSSMEHLLTRFEGRLIKTTGDGFLFEFGSVFDAFDFAAAVQSRAPDEEAIQLRMGLNVGDIIFDDGDVFGDGVNVAARLEPLSPPGGLMVSNRAWEDLRRLPLAFEDAGEIELKNIKERLRAWRLQNEQLREYSNALEVDRDEPAASGEGLPESRSSRISLRTSRRSLLIAGSAALSVAATGVGAWRWLSSGDKPPAEVEALLAQAWQAWTQGTSDGNAQAIGLYRRATEISPAFADSWGLLSCAYGDRGHGMAGAERTAVWERALEAGRRALSLDPRNAYGRMGIAYARPLRGNWGLMEREFRQAENDQPGKFLVVYSLGLLLGDVGRFEEAADLFGSLKGAAPTAMQYLFHTQALWASGQPVEAERVIAEADDIFGSHPAMWRQRLNMALHSGRETTAIAQMEDTKARPEAIEPSLLEVVADAARAVLSRDPAAQRKVADGLSQYARRGTSAAGLAIELACLLGQPDAAFRFAEALFFSREFVVPDQTDSSGAISGVTLDDRRTRVLFLPSTVVMRKDPRFERTLDELGLEAYWRDSGSTPDYRKT
jgi:class 3 adenylate cyclase